MEDKRLEELIETYKRLTPKFRKSVLKRARRLFKAQIKMTASRQHEAVKRPGRGGRPETTERDSTP